MRRSILGRNLVISLAIAVLLACVTTAMAKPFYEGKTIKIITVHPPGGGYDTYARLFARHMGKHIPGSPKVIVINMPGASGLIGTNYVYNVLKPDGLSVIQLSWGVAQAQFLNFPGIKYDVNNFIWLGLANTGPITAVVRKDSPIQTMDQWLDPKTKPLIFGCTSLNSPTCNVALAMNGIFGKTSTIVAGYAGTAAVRAAMLQKEVDALTGWTWDSVKSTGMSMIDDGDIKLMAYIGYDRHPELDARNVPFLNERITKPGDIAFMNVLLLPVAMLRPWALAPKTPGDKVTILGEAFNATLKDTGFLADAKRVRLDINPKSGKELVDLIASMKLQMTPDVIRRARKAVGLKN